MLSAALSLRPLPAGTSFRFRLNWGAGGKRVETVPEFSIFVGDLAPDVTDYMLQQVFVERFPSTLGAKVRGEGGWGVRFGAGSCAESREGARS